MGKRKYNKAEPLTHLIGVRTTKTFYDKLETLRATSNCQTLAEFARMILMQEKIIWYHKDASSDAISVELTGIRKELKAIGTNVNQITRYFNSTSIPQQKIYEALKVLEEYKKVSGQIEKLLTVLDAVIQ